MTDKYDDMDDNEYHRRKEGTAARVRYLESQFTLESWEALLDAAQEIYYEQEKK